MRKDLLISFIAEDRTGIVERLSSLVASHHGNWEDAQLARLGGKFTGLALVNLPAGEVISLRRSLASLTGEAIDCRITEAGNPPASGGLRLTLRVLGPDRPGIVHEISRALCTAGINLLRLESSVRSAPMSGEQLFQATIRATAPASLAREALDSELETIADSMSLEIDMLQDED